MIRIRAATTADLPGAYRVCLLTGDAGRDGTALFRNPDLLGHVYVGPYIVGSPDLARIVADPEGVAGYLLAALDTRAFEAWEEEAWWPALREQYPLTDDATADGDLIRAFHHPHGAPAGVVAEYPSHLHLDLLERARGRGLGRALIEGLLVDLRARGSRGMHLDVATANENAIAFYRHLGFETLEVLEDTLVMGMRLD